MVLVRRHARDWIAYLACGGLVLIALVWSVLTREQESAPHASAPTSSSTQQPPQATSPTFIPPAPDSYVYPYRCDRPETATYDNLCQERRAARASEKQVVWAERTFWLGVAGSIFIVGTLIATAIAAWAAQVAAQATVKSVDAADRSAKAAEKSGHGDRAWVCCEDVTINPTSNTTYARGKPPSDGAIIAIIWRNAGRSPALNVSSHIDVVVVGINDPIPRFPRALKPRRSSIGHQMSVYSPTKFVIDADLRDVRSYKSKIITYCFVEYQDIFKSFSLRRTEITSVTRWGGTETAYGKTPVDRWIHTFEGDQNGIN